MPLDNIYRDEILSNYWNIFEKKYMPIRFKILNFLKK